MQERRGRDASGAVGVEERRGAWGGGPTVRAPCDTGRAWGLALNGRAAVRAGGWRCPNRGTPSSNACSPTGSGGGGRGGERRGARWLGPD
jgi:hypothetical protein